jgi:uncharacterized protein
MEHTIITESWKVIAPFWPLKNLIAVNPLQGLEDFPFETALKIANSYFQTENLPSQLEEINIQTIKWIQVYCDTGQATITMPARNEGFFKAWQKMAIFDSKLTKNDVSKCEFLSSLPSCPLESISKCLELLKIKQEQEFLTLLLTTLPGWASYVKYQSDWAEQECKQTPKICQTEYLAVRVIITYLLWPNASELVTWHKNIKNKHVDQLDKIKQKEATYREKLMQKISSTNLNKDFEADTQFVFCIDVRSEPIRKAIEQIGNYETFGFAGFFGLPVKIENLITGYCHNSCPVLLKPKHKIIETYNHLKQERSKFCLRSKFKLLYQSLKYNFTSPFGLVETLGFMSAFWMVMKSFALKLQEHITQVITPDKQTIIQFSDIAFADQCSYAEGALKGMGLTKNFAKLIIFCGHESATVNNAFASSLDCGACGGGSGANNAKLLAEILNQASVRKELSTRDIIIPEQTLFMAAVHNTTSDKITLFKQEFSPDTNLLERDLNLARIVNSYKRMNFMDHCKIDSHKQTKLKSLDWSDPRPEWGLARNAAFIIAPRSLTKNIDLEGRCFLHSYDYSQDLSGDILSIILTAPMVVAQWINSQYFFSTMDNIAFGAGSKITSNITGKIGIIQGNASDLMTGLPLQSVYSSDNENHHELQRLLTVIYAPKELIEQVIAKEEILKKLFGNGWVNLVCIDPTKNNEVYIM